MLGLEVAYEAMIGMLPDLSRKAAVIRRWRAKLTVVQNIGLDRIVALQYRHTWASETTTSLCSSGFTARKPVLFVRLSGSQMYQKMWVRISGGIRYIGFRKFAGCWGDKELGTCRGFSLTDDSAGVVGTHRVAVKDCGGGGTESGPNIR